MLHTTHQKRPLHPDFPISIQGARESCEFRKPICDTVVSREDAVDVSTVLDRIAAGDADAVQECIDTYGGLVWSIARRFSKNREDSEDAVQQVFVEVWKSAERFDASLSSEKNFVALIARRLLISRLRKSSRAPEQVDIEPVADFTPDETQDVERSAEASLAAEALKVLSPEQRRMVQLSIYYGMSHGEIAELTQSPIGTVKSHIRRGLQQVREQLSIAGISPGGA